MARLNEPPIAPQPAAETIDAGERHSGDGMKGLRADEGRVVKRRFLRQNRELAKYVRIQSTHIRGETRLTHAHKQNQLPTIHPHPHPRKRLLPPPRRKPLAPRTSPTTAKRPRSTCCAPFVREHRCRESEARGQDGGAGRAGCGAGGDEEGG